LIFLFFIYWRKHVNILFFTFFRRKIYWGWKSESSPCETRQEMGLVSLVPRMTLWWTMKRNI
jgi:hypothetical protein